jgi:hypothetical protein
VAIVQIIMPYDERWVRGSAPTRKSIGVVFDMASTGEGSSRLHLLTFDMGALVPKHPVVLPRRMELG